MILTAILIGAGIGALAGFGTVAYSDYSYDEKIFDGSVGWRQYVGGTLIGAVLGAGTGGIIGAGGIYLTGAIASTSGKLITDLFAYLLTEAPMGTWEDYAVAFISGGLYSGMDSIPKAIANVIGQPMMSQFAKIGTNRQDSFNYEKLDYDVITRAATYFFPSQWKPFAKGFTKSGWHLINN